MKNLILGIDGGGTYTRAALTDMDGKFVSSVERPGAASMHKDPNARENVHGAVREVLGKAGRSLSDIAAAAIGTAGLAERASNGFDNDYTKMVKLLGDLAPCLLQCIHAE